MGQTCNRKIGKKIRKKRKSARRRAQLASWRVRVR